MAGGVGILSGSADIFRSNITMSILVAYTAIVFTEIDRKGSVWLAVLTMLTLACIVAISPIHYEAEKIQLVALFGSVLAVITYGKHIQDIYRFRVFVLQMRDELRNEEAARRNEQLSSIAFTDRLTGIPNRRYFDEIADTINADPEQVLPLAICMLDIDHFKNLNDVLGHLQGDRCLRVVATTIRNHLRQKGDILARFGGEEFVLLLPNTDATEAREVAERVREAVFSLKHPNPGTVLGLVSISAGLAVAVTAGGVAGLLQDADRALYRAKAGGRNRVEI
jgi:diguanylate cyclase (GGDEF)-like protein